MTRVIANLRLNVTTAIAIGNIGYLNTVCASFWFAWFYFVVCSSCSPFIMVVFTISHERLANFTHRTFIIAIGFAEVFAPTGVSVLVGYES